MYPTLCKAVALTAALLPLGCVTSKTNVHDAALDYTIIEPGNVSYHFKDGQVQEESFPKESPIKIKDGQVTHQSAGVPRELELGWDMFGLKPRPFVGSRVFYILDFGGFIGADENAFLCGLDYRYKDILLGPAIGVPWLDPSSVIYGGKIALPLNW